MCPAASITGFVVVEVAIIGASTLKTAFFLAVELDVELVAAVANEVDALAPADTWPLKNIVLV